MNTDCGSPPTQSWSGSVQQKIHDRREARAERKWTKEQILAIRRETPAFAILQGIDPDNQDPPPYINVRSRMLYNHVT